MAPMFDRNKVAQRKVKRRVSAFAGALILATSIASVYPTDARAQSQALIDALTAAYLNNPTLLARRARLRSTDEGIPQALSDWRPDVSMSVDGGYSDVHNSGSTGTGQNQWRNSAGYSVDLTQPLFRGGRTLAATSEAENNVRAERARLLGVEQTILLSTISAYMDAFRDEAVLKLNINNEQVLARQLEATRDRFEVGEITRTDVHQAEARRAQAKADRIQSEGDLEASRAAYLNAVGEAAPGNLAAPDMPSGIPDTKEDSLKIAAVKSPTVIAAEFARLAALDNADEVWGELLPELELTAGYSRAFEGSAEQGHIDTAKVGVSLAVPIYQQGAVYSRLREARQDAAELAFTVDEQRRVAVETASRAWESLQTAKARVVSFNAQIDASVVALEGVQREASVGSRTVLDVLDAEQELLDARVSHVRARRDELVAMYEVKSALGQMTARDLELPVTLYDPREHYREVRDKWFGGHSSGDSQ
jgi:outer membrane protein